MPNRKVFHALILRPLLADFGRTLLSVVAVALGVATVVAIRMANRTALESFRANAATLAGSGGLLVTGAAPIPASLLKDLAPIGGVAEFNPYLDRFAIDAQADDALEIFGLDFVAAAATQGGFNSPGSGGLSNGLWLSAAYAQRHGYRAGSPITLEAGGARHTLRVAGVLPSGSNASVNLALLDLPAALALFEPNAAAPSFDGLRLAPAPGVNESALAARLTPLLPATLGLESASERAGRQAAMLAAFRSNLTALALVSLLVGVFLIYNTVSIAVVRRRVAIATLRALGLQRRAVILLFAGEGLALALPGGGLGLALGCAFAGLATGLVSRTVNSLYAPGAVGRASFTWADAAWGLGFAFAAGCAAAWAPARQAASVAPAEALRAASEEGRTRRHLAALASGAVACGALALLLPRLPEPGNVPFFGWLDALAVVALWACLTPLILTAALPRLRQACLARGWAAAGLAAGSLAAALRRSAVLVMALGAALGVAGGVAIMVASFRATVDVWLGQQLRADVFVRAADWSREHPVELPGDAVSRLIALPGVAAAEASRTIAWSYDALPITINTRWWLSAGATGEPAPQYRFLAGAPRPGGVLISEPFARRFHVWPGDTLALATPRGEARWPVAAVFYDYASDRGEVVLTPAQFAANFGPPAPTELGLYAAPGLGASGLAGRVEAALASAGGAGALTVHANAALRAEAMRVFDQTFRITWALEAIALLVAVLGAANTLLAVALERGAELTVLRCLGAGRGWTARLLVAEAAWAGAFGLLIGGGIAACLAVVLVRVINVASFGWTIQWHPPFGFLALAAVGAWLATLAAGLLPAWSAPRRLALQRLAGE